MNRISAGSLVHIRAGQGMHVNGLGEMHPRDAEDACWCVQSVSGASGQRIAYIKPRWAKEPVAMAFVADLEVVK